MKGKFDAYVKFGFSEKATKFEKIFVDFLTSMLLRAQNTTLFRSAHLMIFRRLMNGKFEAYVV